MSVAIVINMISCQMWIDRFCNVEYCISFSQFQCLFSLPLKHVHVGSCSFASANVIIRRAAFEFTYVQCACITGCNVNKYVCACVNGTATCGYSKHRLVCADVIRDLLISAF